MTLKNESRGGGFYPTDVDEYVDLLPLLDSTMLSFPVNPFDRNIVKFEKSNRLRVNVFGLTPKTKVFPVRLSDAHDALDNIDLLLIQREDEGLSHYVAISSLEKLVRGLNAETRNKRGRAGSKICRNCMHLCHTETSYKKHQAMCLTNQPQLKHFYKGQQMQFEDHVRMEPFPWIVFGDLESYLDRDTPQVSSIATHTINEHKNAAAAAALFDSDSNLVRVSLEHVRIGEDSVSAVGRMLTMIENWARDIVLPSLYAKMKCSKEEITVAKKRAICCICEERIVDRTDMVCDHSHITGKFNGVAHNLCNLKRVTPKRLVIVFHNFSGYDSHYIIQALNKAGKLAKTKVIAQSSEKYMTIQYKAPCGITLSFIDSYLFLSRGLSTLAATMDPDDNFMERSLDQIKKCAIVEAQILTRNGTLSSRERAKFLTRKGVFCYEALDSIERLQILQLPSRASFYSHLMQSDVSEEDYTHAQRVFTAFGCANLADYMDIYLLTDVLLLAQVFQRFRVKIHHHFGLDPAHFLSTPHLSWSACLKMTKQKLDYIPDEDTLLYIERACRGGFVQIGRRYARANNKYIDGYDSSSPIYLILM